MPTPRPHDASEYSQTSAILTEVPIRLALTGILALLAAAQAGDPEVLFRRAVEEHQAGNLDAAVRDYRASLEIAPQNFQARSNLGAALAGLGRYAEAIEQYRQVLASAPAQEGVRLNLALAYYKSAQIPKAVTELEALLPRHPEDLRLNLLLGDCYLRQGEFAKVASLLQPLEPAHQDDLALAYLLGTALIRGGRVREGSALVDRILRSGESAEARLLMATAAMMSRDYPTAIGHFQRAAALNSHLPSLQSLYGRALLETGDAEAATAAFHSAIEDDPGDFDAHFQLGQILRQRGSLDPALAQFQDALRARPGNPDVRYAIADAQAAAGRYREARQGLEELLREAPAFRQGHARLAEVYARLGMTAAAARERRFGGTGGPADDLPLRPGDAAPDFHLLLRGATRTTGPGDYRGKSPLLLVFGSYTCPYLRAQIDAINALYDRYGTRLGFLMVYVREAHTSATWQSTRNEREGIALPPAATLDEKVSHAGTCARNLKIRFPVAVDGMDQKVENAFQAWPSAAFLLDKMGRIVWRSRLNEQLFDRAALESAIERMLAPAPAPGR